MIDRQYQSQTVTSICTGCWVLGYSVGSLVCGLVYEFVNIKPLLLIQIFGFACTGLLHVYLRLNGYSFQKENKKTAAAVLDAKNKTATTKTTNLKQFPAVLWCFVFLPLFYQGGPIAIFMVFVKLYQQRFGIGPTVSCFVQMIGDVLGSLWCIAKGQLRTIYKTKKPTNRRVGTLANLVKQLSRVWIFRSPRDVSFCLFGLSIAMFAMCTNSLPVVIVGHITTGALYVFISQSASNGLLIYAQDPRYDVSPHRVLNMYQMICTVSIKVVSSFVSPFLLTVDLNLALASGATVAFAGSLVVAVVFLFRIKNRFHSRGQSYTRLSKSVYKLEAELWDSEIESKTQIEMITPSPPSPSKDLRKQIVSAINGPPSTSSSAEEEEEATGAL